MRLVLDLAHGYKAYLRTTMNTSEANNTHGATLTRGELAKRSTTHFETIRFYESQGLIRPAFRDSSNYRRYRPEEAQRLKCISMAKSLGFTLKEIASILEIYDNSESACQELGEYVKMKILEIDERIADLESKKGLLKKLDACSAEMNPHCDCDLRKRVEDIERSWDCRKERD